jgi:hypothetical protein
MKKILILLLILIYSCETPEQESCNCEKALYLDNAPVGCYNYYTNVLIDCQTRQPLQTIQNSTFIKCLDE